MTARLLRLCCYPWAAWRLSRWLADGLRPAAAPPSRLAFRTLSFSMVGFPLTFLLSAELVFRGNGLLLGRHSDHQLRSDFGIGFEGPLQLPGQEDATELRAHAAGPIPARADRVHAWLVRRHSPVVLQRIGAHPRWDIPVLIDFDGNGDPRDNVRNAERATELEPGIYGEVTAETENEYYLSYSIYHLRDYDHPIRALASAKAEHDNDHEGLMVRVTKADLRVSEVMTWYHSRFFHCARRPDSAGTERVMGRLHLENETHPIVYVQAMGHGVRCAQSIDLEDLRGLKIFRHGVATQASTPRLDDSSEFGLRYEIDTLDRWYAQALGPFDERGMFQGHIRLGFFPSGQPIEIGRFIAGAYAGEDSWARPKPAWSWDDAWDEVPIAVAHFFPSRTFRSHLGIETSSVYLDHRAARLTFELSPDELWKTLEPNVARTEGRKNEKWRDRFFDADHPHVRRDHVHRAARRLLKRYVDYLFRALG